MWEWLSWVTLFRGLSWGCSRAVSLGWSHLQIWCRGLLLQESLTYRQPSVLGWLSARGLSSHSEVGLSVGLQVSSHMATSFPWSKWSERERKRVPDGSHGTISWSWKWHIFPSAVFFQTHRPALPHVGGTTQARVPGGHPVLTGYYHILC